MSTNLTSNLSNDQIWLGFPVRLTRIAGSLTSPIRLRLGLRLEGGIWSVTLKRVCFPSSSAKTLASRARALARTMSSLSWAKLRRNTSSFSCAHRSERGVPAGPIPPRDDRPLISSEEKDEEGDMGERNEVRSCWKCRSYSCRWRCRARCLSSSCCFSKRAMAVCIKKNHRTRWGKKKWKPIVSSCVTIYDLLEWDRWTFLWAQAPHVQN